MVLGCKFYLCKKNFTEERKIMIKHVHFKERKKALQIAPKRSAVIPTLQKDPPLLPLHKKIRRYHTKVSSCKRVTKSKRNEIQGILENNFKAGLLLFQRLCRERFFLSKQRKVVGFREGNFGRALCLSLILHSK